MKLSPVEQFYIDIEKKRIEAEKALQLAYTDLIAFGKLFLAGDFGKSKSPIFHYEIGDALLENTTKSLVKLVG